MRRGCASASSGTRRGDSGGRHARQRRHPLADLAGELLEGDRGAVARLGQRELQGHHARGLEAGIGGDDPGEAPRQQGRPRDHQQGHGHLAGHQDDADDPSGPAAGGPRRILLERIVQVGARRLEGRRQTEQQAGEERESEGEEEDGAVDADLRQHRTGDRPSLTRRAQGEQRLDRPCSQQHAESASRESEEKALGEELRHDPRGACTQGRAEGHLAAPRRGARQLQIGQVDAGDEQDEPDRAEQDQQGRPEVAVETLLERHQPHRLPFVHLTRPGLVVPLRQDVHLGLCLFERHAVLEPRGDLQIVRLLPGRRIDPHRGPELGRGRIPEPVRHDPHHGIGLPVQRHRPANQRPVTAEAALPETVAQDHHLGTIGQVLLGEELAPHLGLDGEDLEEIEAHPRAV